MDRYKGSGPTPVSCLACTTDRALLEDWPPPPLPRQQQQTTAASGRSVRWSVLRVRHGGGVKTSADGLHYISGTHLSLATACRLQM